MDEQVAKLTTNVLFYYIISCQQNQPSERAFDLAERQVSLSYKCRTEPLVMSAESCHILSD